MSDKEVSEPGFKSKLWAIIPAADEWLVDQLITLFNNELVGQIKKEFANEDPTQDALAHTCQANYEALEAKYEQLRARIERLESYHKPDITKLKKLAKSIREDMDSAPL